MHCDDFVPHPQQPLCPGPGLALAGRCGLLHSITIFSTGTSVVIRGENWARAVGAAKADSMRDANIRLVFIKVSKGGRELAKPRGGPRANGR